MTEIPPHLLERSRARRAALGLSTEGEAAATAAPAPAAAASPTPAPAAAPAPAPVEAAPPAPPPPPPPYVEAALKRKKIPFWAMPVLLSLPLWAYFYVGTLESPPEEAAGLLAMGEEVYAQCAACHGAAGGGGVGPAFAGGAVLETWPDPVDHIEWVAKGSAGWGRPNYGAQGKPVQGGMPGYAASLTEEELVAVVMYERVTFGEDPAQEELLAALDEAVESGALTLEGNYPADVTADMIRESLGEALGAAG